MNPTGPMLSAIDGLETAFTTFQSSTFTDTIWHGSAANNAKSLISDKIMTKTTKAKTKLGNLNSAIAIAKECDELKSKITQTKNAMSAVDRSTDAGVNEYSNYTNNLNSYNASYQAALGKLIKLCS